jgi:hypothetical protein
MKNRTNIIGIIVFSCGVDLGPVELALVSDARFIVSDSFTALLLSVIKYLAVTTEFTITRVAG